jgi:hypothetical protein
MAGHKTHGQSRRDGDEKRSANREERQAEADKAKAEKMEALKTKVPDAEIKKAIESIGEEYTEGSKDSQHGPQRTLPARGLFDSLYKRLTGVLAKIAAAAKIPFVRSHLPELRRIVTEMVPEGFAQSTLLYLLDQYELAIPETEEEADIAPERLTAKA